MFDAVDLRFRAAGDEADPFEDVVAGQVGRGHRRETLAQEYAERVTLQRQFQKHGLVFEEIKTVPRNGRPALEIDEIELFGQFDVVERLEIELRQRGLAAEEF